MQPGEITRLLQEADRGDREAENRLFVLVENDLKMIARKRKRSWGARGDASTTMLVDDAFLKLVGQEASIWQAGDRRKFFGYASKKIHEMLIKAARAEEAAKRGGGARREQREEDEIADAQADPARDLSLQLDLQEVLNRFERFAPDDALIFRTRYFLNCTFEEVAEIVSVSNSEAKRAYERARLWLETELQEYGHDQ